MAKKKDTRDERSIVKDKLALYIATCIIRLRQSVVARLSSWESRCSNKGKRIILLLFCALFGGYLVFVLIATIFLPVPAGGNMMLPATAIPQLSLPPPTTPDTSTSTQDF